MILPYRQMWKRLEIAVTRKTSWGSRELHELIVKIEREEMGKSFSELAHRMNEQGETNE